MRNAFRIATSVTGLDAPRQRILGCGEPIGEQVSSAHCLPRASDIWQIAGALELHPPLVEQTAREIEVAEPHVQIADTQERATLKSRHIPPAPFLENAGECIERTGKISLRRERAPEPIERARLA